MNDWKKWVVSAVIGVYIICTGIVALYGIWLIIMLDEPVLRSPLVALIVAAICMVLMYFLIVSEAGKHDDA